MIRIHFPSKLVLWRGAILGGIVNATMIASNSGYACFQCWRRNHYILNGADGREGAVTFAGGHWFGDAPLVGVFYDVRSRIRWKDESNLDQRFQGCPAYQRCLADQRALELRRDRAEGSVECRVTAVFWDDGEYLSAADAWPVVLAGGANLLENELIEDVEQSLAAWQEAYGMSGEQVGFALRLWERKLARPPATIELSGTEVRWLTSTFIDPRQMATGLQTLWTRSQMDQPTGQGEHATPDLKWLDSIDAQIEAQKALMLSSEAFAELGILFSKRVTFT